MVSDKIVQKLNSIEVIFTDVDGVLTDGGLYYNSKGLELKKFNVKDGMGVIRLRNEGFKVGIISSDDSEIIKVRAAKLNMDFIITGCFEKENYLKDFCETEQIGFENVAYIGDDVNDLEIIKLVGFSAAPEDAVAEIISSVDYVCRTKGGTGAFREFADLILACK